MYHYRVTVKHCECGGMTQWPHIKIKICYFLYLHKTRRFLLQSSLPTMLYAGYCATLKLILFMYIFSLASQNVTDTHKR